ncbi:MAG: STAS domain-containing protein [bacterium]
MKINKISNEKVKVRPEGSIDFTNSQELKKELLNLFDEGFNKIIIDFERVESIDSSGLGKLLLFQKKLKERDGILKIINVTSDYIKNMFDMIHLNKVIDIEGIE